MDAVTALNGALMSAATGQLLVELKLLPWRIAVIIGPDRQDRTADRHDL